MSSYPQSAHRLLVCSSDLSKTTQLAERVRNAGFEVECVTDTECAKQRLWEEHFSGIAVDLLLPRQDGISFALEVRREHPWLPVLVLNSEAVNREAADDTGSPDWLTRSSEQARMIFALKQASVHNTGLQPSILHVEEDDAMAALVFRTLGGQISLFRARTIQEAQIAMSLRKYDLALVNSHRPIPDPANMRQLTPDTLLVNNHDSIEPLLTILNQLRRPDDIHEPAHC